MIVKIINGYVLWWTETGTYVYLYDARDHKDQLIGNWMVLE